MSQNTPTALTITSDNAVRTPLRQSEEHFETLVSGVEDYAIFLLSPEGHVTTWNIGAERIKGYKPEEIIGKHFSVFYPPEALKPDWPAHILRTAAKEGKFADEGWRVRKDGSKFWASVVVTALRAQNGELRGFLKITGDLTERRKIEALQMADRQKNEFLATLSHELRTHLNAILGWIDLMNESRHDETIISQGFEVLRRNAETLTDLVSGLLDISRIATGTLTLNFEEVDLKDIVRSSVQTLQILAARKRIALKSVVEIPEELACRVWGDKVGLLQILANILANALKFTPDEGAVTVHLTRAQAMAILTVKDTGIGMSPDFLPHAFEQFTQAKSSDKETRGLGLGLAICKHLVELFNGSISAESEGIGRGTTLRVKLPLVPSKSSPSFESSEDMFTKEVGVTDSRLRYIKVLAVDDDADTRELLKFILQRSSADATVVGSGAEALEAIKKVRPDVLICDLGMSQMDGYELLKNVRRLESDVGRLPSIAFTASARTEDRIRSQRVGFQAYLIKPVIADELVTTIVQVVKPHSQRQS
jgi:PAS domain S-box-containing protein